MARIGLDWIGLEWNGWVEGIADNMRIQGYAKNNAYSCINKLCPSNPKLAQFDSHSVCSALMQVVTTASSAVTAFVNKDSTLQSTALTVLTITQQLSQTLKNSWKELLKKLKRIRQKWRPRSGSFIVSHLYLLSASLPEMTWVVPSVAFGVINISFSVESISECHRLMPAFIEPIGC